MHIDIDMYWHYLYDKNMRLSDTKNTRFKDRKFVTFCTENFPQIQKIIQLEWEK